MMHADRTNRVLLGLLGLLMAAAGVAAILAGTRMFGDDVPDRSLVDNPVGDYVGRHGDWLWPALAIVALVLIALALWWLSTIAFSTDRIGQIDMPGQGPGARTTLVAGALTDAVTREIEGYRGVGSARAAVVGAAGNPILAVTVDTERNADLAGLYHRIETGALANARLALANPNLPARVDLTLRRREGARVA